MTILGAPLIDWLTLLVGLVSAMATVVLTYVIFHWTQKAEKNEITRGIQNDWRDYNLAVLGDQDLQTIEAGNHLFEGLSSFEVKKMCIYFIKLNVPYNMWIAAQNHFLDMADVDRELDNQAALMHRDQEFIETHIFPRGYDDAFCALLRKRWIAIDRSDDGKDRDA
ncbi:hypothetical protein SAMN04488030_2592 [Aliiroseovarius halocynthiae]|uniref:DUF4760 domain-containing protein n=1 Tax=Aliiroseovarius halocynthiae TaxID=985055 RepID=A0A545SPX5_9RHOB|nr:hypothetical protein [Aliiroseovarius halocynthiae]TQV67035.1 hypothetical protein FIL88_10625 [Aliiroseovarius halocynthiae]SMR82246.1 hypothetical protein SAMN04488030_2592 [Aliiroseovarius halocynthiae]